MSKKTWILISCLVLSLALGLGGSLAYLTDTDTKVNTFTMGNVDIELEEEFPGDENNSVSIRPGVQVTKQARIWNTGDNDAYVWMTVAVPTKFDTPGFDENNDQYTGKPIDLIWGSEIHQYPYAMLGFNDAGQPFFEEGNANNYYTVKLNDMGERADNGEEYNVYTIIRQEPLGQDERTPNLLRAVSMNPYLYSKNVEINEGEWQKQWYEVTGGNERHLPALNGYEGEAFNVFVSAYAIQAEGFDGGFQDAYDAYVEQWGGVQSSTAAQMVYDAEQLREALKNGGRITLMSDIDLGEENFLSVTNDVSINLNKRSITRQKQGTLFFVDGDNARLYINGWGTLNTNGGQAIFVRSGEAVIDGVQFDDGSATHVYVQQTGKAIIREGYFHPTTSGKYLLNKQDSASETAEIEVRGGTYVEWNPANHNGDPNAPIDYVAEGCEVWCASFERGDGEYDRDYVVLDTTRDDYDSRRNDLENSYPDREITKVYPETNP